MLINPFINPFKDNDDDLEPLNEDQKKQIRKQKIKNTALGSLYGIDALASYNESIKNENNFESKLRNVNQQAPIFDYNYMYGQNTNGGSEFQPIIKAKNGALVRTTISDSANFKIDNGEIIILPNGEIEEGKGNPNKTDDISTILPDGTMIFSNELKPIGSNKTFAKIAKKNDYTKELEILKNPYSNEASKNSASLMLQRKQEFLNKLFEEQQKINKNSTGEIENSELKEGEEIDVTEEELNTLKEKGYNLEILE